MTYYHMPFRASTQPWLVRFILTALKKSGYILEHQEDKRHKKNNQPNKQKPKTKQKWKLEGELRKQTLDALWL